MIDDQHKLFALIAYCREQKVHKIKIGEVEIEFSQVAMMAELEQPKEETLAEREERFKREAKEHQDLLFYSARP